MRSRFTSRIRSRFRSSVSDDVGAFRSSSASPPVPGIAAPTLTITGGTTDTSLTPELNGSAYTQVGGNAESHASTDWQVSDASDFSNIVWEAAASASLTQITVGLDLEDNTTYYARVRYNSASYVSDWSAGVEFNTVNIFVTTPSITSPSDAATDIGETPTITSSAFAVTGGSDTHASSDWQIASDSGFSTIVVQSLDDASNLESWDVPSGNLQTSTTYYVRVRHTGTDEGDSAWSAGVSFTTASAFVSSSITYLGHQDNLSDNSPTISANLGTAETGRIIALAIICNNSSFPTNITIAGQSVTQAVQVNPGGLVDAAIYYVRLDTGTTGDIEFNRSNSDVAIAWWAIYGCAETPSDTATAAVASGVSAVCTFDQAENAQIVWVQARRSDTSLANTSYDGSPSISEDETDLVYNGGNRHGAAGHIDADGFSAETARDFTIAAESDVQRVAVAVWAP